MSLFFGGAAAFVLLTVLGGLVRVARGPTSTDRMMTASLFASGGVAVLLLLGEVGPRHQLRDMALLVALLAALAAVVFATRRTR
ncbi:monovalent cation/H+ antiporter complex subunit F [Vulgatibacter sp.]|uniref:monovalent cation/H+ antiporter complex subunit F n=1 Tax=Vulgatibacter sp. TaxID=1971226 RepID=UPI003569C2D1